MIFWIGKTAEKQNAKKSHEEKVFMGFHNQICMIYSCSMWKSISVD